MAFLKKLLSRVASLLVVFTMLFAMSPVEAAQFSSMHDTMTRVQVSTAADHVVVLTLPTGVDFSYQSGASDVLAYTYPSSSAFTTTGTWATSDFTFNDGTSRTVDAVAQGSGTSTVTCTDGANNVGVAIDTTALVFRVLACGSSFVASSTAATVTFTILGTSPNGVLTNPTGAGSYTLSVSMTDTGVAAANSGSIGLGIVTSDQVAVTASVDPSLTFNVGATSSSCSTAFSGNGGTVALGTIPSSSTVASSDNGGVFHICEKVSTNAGSGYAVSVHAATNNGLVSTSTPGDHIPSSTAAVTPGTANYGICFGTTGGDTGHTTTSPDGADPAAVSPFNTTCTGVNTAQNVGGLTTTPQNIASGSIPVSNAFATIRVKAAASIVTVAHSDYTDTLTFVATGTF